MKQTSSAQKVVNTTTSTATHDIATGSAGAAVAPPTYGIDLVDQPPVQRMTDVGSHVAEAPQANNTGLPDNLKVGIEWLSGLAMDDVKVHYNSNKPAQLQALAYAQGTEIHVGPGQERHLPHEAWHVVQQKQGRVNATLQTKGVLVNDDKRLEYEADIMGKHALSIKDSKPFATEASFLSTGPVQRAMTNPLPLPAVSSNVVQRASTKLAFETDVTGKSKITATQHNRSGVHKIAQDWVLANGGWKTVPGTTVCNHSKGYDPMAQEILNEIHDTKLHKAAKTVKEIYGNLQAKNMGIGNPTSTHKKRLQDIIDDPDDDVDTDDVVDSFNYYIYKICDYPRNLFFWPNRTGGDPDEPKGEYGDDPAHDWEVSNGIISNKARLSREKKRLADGRQDLVNALT